MQNYKLDIIVPTYFEQENIENVVKGIEKYVRTPHLINVVIQDKKDPTIPIVTQLKKTISPLRILYTDNGKGMLYALKTGMEKSKSPIVLITMADLSDDPRDIDKMVAKIDDGYDLVCAARYIKGGKHIGGPFIKGFLSYAGCKTLRFFTGIPTNDATNAFKCFKRTILKDIEIESEEGFALPLELVVKAYRKGFAITEIPTLWRDREKGRSKFSIWRNIGFYLRWYWYGIASSPD